MRKKSLKLVIFDENIILYNDEQCLTPDNPVISRIIKLLFYNIKIGITTAAEYAEDFNYFEKL